MRNSSLPLQVLYDVSAGSLKTHSLLVHFCVWFRAGHKLIHLVAPPLTQTCNQSLIRTRALGCTRTFKHCSCWRQTKCKRSSSRCRQLSDKRQQRLKTHSKVRFLETDTKPQYAFGAFTVALPFPVCRVEQEPWFKANIHATAA